MINLESASREELLREINRLRLQVSSLEQQSSMGHMRSIVGLDEKVIQLDEQDQIEYINAAMSKLIGIDRNQVLGKHISVLDDYKWGKGELQRILKHAKQTGQEFNEEKNYFDDEKEKYFYVNIKCSITGNKTQILIEDLTDKKMLETTFKRYVPPAVIERMLEVQEEKDFFKADRYEMTVLFGDLRGFTAWSESLPPEKVRDTVNLYLSAMTEVISQHGATLDKFVGDEVMALFGAPLYYPDHAVRALKVALDMQEAHKKTLGKWEEMGVPGPPLGVGLNTGEMVVGNIGSNMRMDYTVLGHHVNLASRLCGLAKPGEILLGQNTFRLIQVAAKEGKLDIQRNLKFKKVGKTKAKGVSEPIEIILVQAVD
jgi:class 3 adenylate cyclase